MGKGSWSDLFASFAAKKEGNKRRRGDDAAVAGVTAVIVVTGLLSAYAVHNNSKDDLGTAIASRRIARLSPGAAFKNRKRPKKQGNRMLIHRMANSVETGSDGGPIGVPETPRRDSVAAQQQSGVYPNSGDNTTRTVALPNGTGGFEMKKFGEEKGIQGGGFGAASASADAPEAAEESAASSNKGGDGGSATVRRTARRGSGRNSVARSGFTNNSNASGGGVSAAQRNSRTAFGASVGGSENLYASAQNVASNNGTTTSGAGTTYSPITTGGLNPTTQTGAMPASSGGGTTADPIVDAEIGAPDTGAGHAVGKTGGKSGKSGKGGGGKSGKGGGGGGKSGKGGGKSGKGGGGKSGK
jgi:hypothetical protein